MQSYKSLIGLLCLIGLAHFCVDLMLGIWPVYKSLAQLDLATAGLVVGVGAFLGEGSQLIFGSLSDRGYRKWIMLFGLTAATAAVFLPHFTDYAPLFGLYLLTCIGSGAFHPSAAGFVASMMPERRGLLMAIFAASGSLGLAFSQIIFMSSVHAGSSNWLIVPVLCLIPLLFLTPLRTTAPTNHAVNLGDFIAFFKRTDLCFLYIALLVNQTLLWATIFILPDLLKTLDHSEWVCFGGGHLCLIIGGTCMLIPCGYLADRFGPRRIMLAAGVVAACSFYTLLFFGNISQNWTLVNLFILGASSIIVHPIGVSWGVRLVPDKPSTVSAFLMGLVWCLSESIGPGGVGWLSQFFSDYAPVKALAVLGSVFPIAIYAIYSLPQQEAVTSCPKTYNPM